jgi:RNA polymerase sigma-70 factor (ECF subfamily)
MSNLTPYKIIGGFNRREPKAIAWIYDEYYSVVFNLVLKFLSHSSPDIEDLVADSFVKLLRSTGRFDRLDRIRSFLFSTAKNLCLDYLKRKELIMNKSETLELAEPEDPYGTEDADENALYMASLYKAMEKLPRRYYEVLELSYMKGLRSEEIAQKMQLSKKTVANERILAMNKLKAILAKSGLLILLNLFS